MKTKIFGGIAIVVIALAVAFNVSLNTGKTNNASLLALANVEALASESSKPFCYAGGTGSSSCSIDAGVTIAGYGVAGGCSVSCNSGYYACCSLRCVCVKS